MIHSIVTHNFSPKPGIPYSQKIWRGIKFGGFRRNRQIKICQNLYRVHVHMAILLQTTKFRSANTQFGGKPPNLMTANISSYTVYIHVEHNYTRGMYSKCSVLTDCCLLLLRIMRTRDPEMLKGCDVVVDVGGEYNPATHRYDHHQK